MYVDRASVVDAVINAVVDDRDVATLYSDHVLVVKTSCFREIEADVTGPL